MTWFNKRTGFLSKAQRSRRVLYKFSKLIGSLSVVEGSEVCKGICRCFDCAQQACAGLAILRWLKKTTSNFCFSNPRTPERSRRVPERSRRVLYKFSKLIGSLSAVEGSEVCKGICRCFDCAQQACAGLAILRWLKKTTSNFCFSNPRIPERQRIPERSRRVLYKFSKLIGSLSTVEGSIFFTCSAVTSLLGSMNESMSFRNKKRPSFS